MVSADAIIGRDFLSNHKIDVSVRVEEERARVELFSEIAFVNDSTHLMNNTNDPFAVQQADLDQVSYKKLLSVFQEVEKAEVTPPQ